VLFVVRSGCCFGQNLVSLWETAMEERLADICLVIGDKFSVKIIVGNIVSMAFGSSDDKVKGF